MCRRVRQRVAYMRMRWRSRWRSTEAFASSASVRGRGQARDLRAAPADLRAAARPSAGERRGVATRVRVACARRDAPKSEKNPREIPRALERDRETRAWEGDKKEPRASSATVAMQAGALIRIVARVLPHLLILRVPVLVVRERWGGPQDVEVLRGGGQELAVGLDLRGFPTGLHRDRSADTGAPRASDRTAQPGARCSGLGAFALGRMDASLSPDGKSARHAAVFGRCKSSERGQSHDPSASTVRAPHGAAARLRPSLAPARRPGCPRRAEPRTRPGRPCGA
jgi:hypothetical protein